MKKVITTEKLPIKLWLDDIDEETLKQAKNLANLPFIHKHIALMPDFHKGYGMPIGGVIATENVVIPNATGVDIGCGMVACKTSLTKISKSQLKKIKDKIKSIIPVGFSHHSTEQDIALMPSGPPGWFINKYNSPIAHQEFGSARKQLGTLGGGNHFIEIQNGDDSYIWMMIHSGSRNLGYKVANHYNKIAMELNEKWHSKVPKEWELAFLPLDSKEGRMYFTEMQYCVEFAFANRKLMLERTKECFSEIFSDIKYDEMINIAHNYANMENHFGKNVMIHRKGATLARAGTIGIIPGSQGTNSFIVKGLGNKESFNSCSHGAGRKMGRKQAKRELDLRQELEILNKIGTLHTVRTISDLDEATGAYKDINVVMENQNDLVDIIVKLKPLATIKG